MIRRLVSLTAAGALLLAMLGAILPVTAQAANNPLIVATLQGFARVDGLGNPITNPGQMYVGDYIALSVAFDASEADPVPGDSFSVELPDEFSNIEFGRPGREIVKPLMFGSLQVGDCVIEQRKFTCTFNNEIVGQENVKGTIAARIIATAGSDDNEVTLNLNGTTVTATIPGTGGGIGVRQSKFAVSNTIGKGATGVGAASRGVQWVMGVGGGWLVKNLPGQSTFTVIDTLPNTLLTGTTKNTEVSLFRANPATDGRYERVALSNAAPLVAGYGLNYVRNPDGLTYRLEVTTPQEFTNQENYQLIFTTYTSDGQTVDKGWVYENYMQIEGVAQVARGEKFYVESFEAAASFDEGYGAFQVTKKATGAGEISDTQEFAIQVHYVVPDDAPASWTGAKEGTFTHQVSLGTPTLINPQLPAGTRVTVVEDLTVANRTAADGVNWSAPTFAAGNPAEAKKFTITEAGAKIAFTIEADKTLKLDLTNRSTTESTFQVAKTIAGDDASAYTGQAFDFTYTCTDGQSGAVTGVLGDGTPVRISDKVFQTGTVCTVTEVDPPARAGYTLTKPAPVKVTIMNAVQTAQLVNTYRRESADFSITKVLNANGSRGYDTFTAAYECSAPGYGPEADGTTIPATGKVTVTAGQTTLVGRFPVGTTCKVAAEEPQVREGYDFIAPPELGTEVTIDADGEAATITNAYEPHKGTFTVLKVVEAGGSTGPANEKFTLAYTCTPLKRTGLDPVSGTVEVAAGVAAEVGEFLAGTKCVVTGEQAAEREGYTLSQDFGTEVTIEKDTAAQIQVTNTYTRDFGTFAVAKSVSAGGSSGSDTFTLAYSCDAEGRTADGAALAATGKVQVEAGQSTVVGEFPTGAKCSVTGEDDAEREGYSLGVGLGDEVTIVKGATVTATVTNTYTRDFAPFTVVKVVEAGGSTGSDVVTVSYECSAEGADGVAARGEAEVTAGTPKVVGQFPTGTVCRVTGEPGVEQRAGYTLTTDLGSEASIAKDAGGSVTVTNTYSRDFVQLRIGKTVISGGSTGSSTFTVDYACDAEGRSAGDPVPARGSVEVTDGGVTVVGEFPTGTKCSVTGEADAQRVGYTLSQDLGQELVLAKDQGPEAGIQVTNTYTRDFGRFSIAKSLDAGGSSGSAEFAVDYECSAAGDGVAASGKVLVKAGESTVVGSFPTGTSCRVMDEDRAAAQREGYSLGVAFGDAVTIAKDTTVTATVTNTYVRQRGGFVINKTVDGDGAALAPATVPFTYDCADQDPVTVQVTPGVPFPVTDVPTGGCTITEGDASAPGADLATTMTIDAVPSADGAFTITEQATVEVQVSNTYTLQRGTFEVTKAIVSDAALTAGPFKFNYTCGDTTGTLEVPGDGTAVAGPQVPLNTQCTIAEDAASGQVDDYTLTVPEPQTVTVTSQADPVPVAFENNYRRHTAGFAIAKTVEGGPFAADEFTFAYACGDVTGTVKVPGGGAAVNAGVNLPTGTQCRVWEETDSAARPGYRLTAPAEQTVVLTGDGSVQVLAFVNQYAADEPTPEPSPSPSPEPSPSSSPEPSPSPSPEPSPSQSASPESTPSASPSAAEPTPSAKPSVKRPGLPKTGD